MAQDFRASPVTSKPVAFDTQAWPTSRYLNLAHLNLVFYVISDGPQNHRLLNSQTGPRGRKVAVRTCTHWSGLTAA
jgi:hypothetical protein